MKAAAKPIISLCLFFFAFFVFVKPTLAATPVITNAGLTTTYTPWAVWIQGTGLTSGLKIRLIDIDGKQWGADLAAGYNASANFVAAQLPGNTPPSGCNIGKSCTIGVYIVVPTTGTLSNKFNLNLPPGPAPAPVITGASLDTSRQNVWYAAFTGSNLVGDLKVRMIDVDGKQWGADIAATITSSNGTTYASAPLPNISPPSQCNISASCTLSAYLVTSAGALSNKADLVFPAITIPTPFPSATPFISKTSYKVGVDYHSPTAQFNDLFINYYNNPVTRATVINQIKSMVNSGAKIISLRLWMGKNTETDGPFWLMAFPPSQQELQNIRQFVQDVAVLKTPEGENVDLYLTTLRLLCARGDLYKDLTTCDHSFDNLVAKDKKSMSDILDAVGNINRPDGSKAVTIYYYDGELSTNMNTGDRNNVFKANYPDFYAKARALGINPSVYFLVLYAESDITNHNEVSWMKATTDFMKANNFPLPSRLDFSFYVEPLNPTIDNYKRLINSTFTDLSNTYPGYTFGVAETRYMQDATERKKLGQAFAQVYAQSGEPKALTFWTTPDSGGSGVNAGFPFDITSYYLVPPGYFGTPGPTPSNIKQGDLNGDGVVNNSDYQIFIADFGKTGTAGFIPSDIDKNGIVDIFDYNILVDNYPKSGSSSTPTPAPSNVVITSTGIVTSYNPWAVWVRGSNLVAGLKIRLIDVDGKQWGTDLGTAYSSDFMATQLPANSPPSGCNIGKTCTISIYMVSANGALSNKFGVTLPAK